MQYSYTMHVSDCYVNVLEKTIRIFCECVSAMNGTHIITPLIKLKHMRNALYFDIESIKYSNVKQKKIKINNTLQKTK